MASKAFQEKQIEKEKEFAAAEKLEQKDKHEKNEKTETDHKHQKDTKDTKDNKEHKDQKDKPEKEKHEKEKHEKEHKNEKLEKHEKDNFKEKDIHKEGQKELEQQAQMLQPQMAAQQASIQKIVEHKLPNLEKYFKHEKFEQKDKFEKFEKNEKHEIKELEKYQFEGGGKIIYEGPLSTGPGGDPFSQRIATLEAAVAQLLHFIPENMRPDLSQGALKQEADVKQASQDKAAGGAENAGKEEKKK